MRAIWRNNCTGKFSSNEDREQFLCSHGPFTEFCEHFFRCKWPGSITTPINQQWANLCTGDEIISSETGYEAEKQFQFVSDSVLSFPYALICTLNYVEKTWFVFQDEAVEWRSFI